MMRERMLWTVALVLIAGAGFIGGERLGIGIGHQNQAQATQQFLAARGGQGIQAGQGNVAGRGVNGTVSAINGTTLTITVRDGTSTTVQLAADGKVRKQVDGQLTGIHTGDRITAIGALSGNVFRRQPFRLVVLAALHTRALLGAHAEHSRDEQCTDIRCALRHV